MQVSSITFDELVDKVEVMLDIDPTKLVEEVRRGTTIWVELERMYRREAVTLKRLKELQIEAERKRSAYYLGKMTGEHYRKFPLPAKAITQKDLPKYLKTDEMIIKINDKFDEVERKCSFLESAMKRVQNRGYDIKTMLEWQKFQAGAL